MADRSLIKTKQKRAAGKESKQKQADNEKTNQKRAADATPRITNPKRPKRTVADAPKNANAACSSNSVATIEDGSDEEPMCPAMITEGDDDFEDAPLAPSSMLFGSWEREDEKEYVPDDLLTPSANACDVICHCLHMHKWSLNISRDFFCMATGKTPKEFAELYQNCPLLNITSIMVFLGFPADIEKGFIAGVEAIRKKYKRNKFLKSNICFFETFTFSNTNYYCEILPGEKLITVCTFDER